MRVDLFDFELPERLIAQRPVEPRDAARLLEVRRDGLLDLVFRDLPQALRPDDLLVFNDTRVIPARLAGERAADSDGPNPRGAARLDVTLVRRLADGAWQALAKPARRLRIGDQIVFAPDFAAAVRGRGADGSLELAFEVDDGALGALLERHGAMPIPPYIRGGRADGRDRADYQTAYARRDGAVAAPTAGLHFTPALLAALAASGVASTFVTLHVGLGTFQPVRAADTDDHAMAVEWGEVGVEAVAAIAAARARGGRVVAVGTTALRLLETLGQACGEGPLRPWRGDTGIFIVPGFRFRVADLLVTNFHLPRSTLFMLVAAFAGLERMRAAYSHAVAGGYRFYSYGDGSLLHREDRA